MCLGKWFLLMLGICRFLRTIPVCTKLKMAKCTSQDVSTERAKESGAYMEIQFSIRIPSTSATAEAASLPGMIPFKCYLLQYAYDFCVSRCSFVTFVLGSSNSRYSSFVLFLFCCWLCVLLGIGGRQTNELNRMKCGFFCRSRRRFLFGHLHTRLICFSLNVENYHHCSFNWHVFHYFRPDCPSWVHNSWGTSLQSRCPLWHAHMGFCLAQKPIEAAISRSQIIPIDKESENVALLFFLVSMTNESECLAFNSMNQTH